MSLGVRDEPRPEPCPAPIRTHVEAVQLGPARLGPIDRDAGRDAPALVLDDPEPGAVTPEGRGGAPKVREIVVRIDEAARIFGEAERQEPEEILRILVPGRPRLHEQGAGPQSTSSGKGTIVDFTVLMAIASATAREMPSSESG